MKHQVKDAVWGLRLAWHGLADSHRRFGVGTAIVQRSFFVQFGAAPALACNRLVR